MKLPPDTIIATTKLDEYLYGTETKNDKSGFLALAGYNTGKRRSPPERPAHTASAGSMPNFRSNRVCAKYQIADANRPNGRACHSIDLDERRRDRQTKFVSYSR